MDHVRFRSGLYARVVTGYDDARQALNDPRLSKDPRLAPPDWREAGRGRPLEDRSGLGTHLLTLDPPDHTRVRAALSPYFRARRLERLRGPLEELAGSLVDGLAAPFDVVGDFASPYAMAGICEVLGVPARDRPDFAAWTSGVVTGDLAAVRELLDYIPALIAAKRERPDEALVSTAPLDDHELMSEIFLLLVAGYETTVSLIGNAVLALLPHPGRRDQLLLPSAVEELIRYDGPVERSTWRFPVVDVTVGGVAVPAGYPLLIDLAAANHDPARFSCPAELDLARGDNAHLGFGYGRHYCLGAHLARLETRIALTALTRLPGLALAVPEQSLERRVTLTVQGLRELPLTWG